jgi:pyruvate/2-oxoglutarate dehydrogenase complex dihydrolipoamide acyltransferase (E2) component
MQYRVSSTQIEDIHTGATFGPEEVAIGFDPEDPYDAAKLEEGKFVAVADTEPPRQFSSPEAEARAQELGIDPADITPTGKTGITVTDVEKAHENQEAKS